MSLRSPKLAGNARRPIIVGVFVAIALARIYTTCSKLPAHARRQDFSVIYISSLLTREGRNAYLTPFRPLAAALGLDVGKIDHSTDSPAALAASMPLSLLPEPTAFYVWSAINAAALIAALVLLLADFETIDAVVLTALAIIYPPVYIHFDSGQKNILILLLVVVAMRLMARGYDAAAGACVGLAGLLRVFPLLLLGYLAMQRRRRALAGASAVIAAGAAVTFAVLGVRTTLSFSSGLGLIAAQQTWLLQPVNISVRAAAARLFPGPAQALAICVLGDALLLSLTGWRTLAFKSRHDPHWRLLGLWVMTAILVSPIAWSHYLVLALIVQLQIVRAAREDAANLATRWLALSGYLLAVAVPILVMLAHGSPNPVLKEGWFGAAFLTYLAAWSFCAMPGRAARSVGSVTLADSAVSQAAAIRR